MFWLINKEDCTMALNEPDEFIEDDESYYILDTNDLVVEKLTGKQVKEAFRLLGTENFVNLYEAYWEDTDSIEVWFDVDKRYFEDRIPCTVSLNGKVRGIYSKGKLWEKTKLGVEINGVQSIFDENFKFDRNGLYDMHINGELAFTLKNNLHTMLDIDEYDEEVYSFGLSYFFKESYYLVVRYIYYCNCELASSILTLYYDFNGNLIDVSSDGDIVIKEKKIKTRGIVAKKCLLGRNLRY